MLGLFWAKVFGAGKGSRGFSLIRKLALFRSKLLGNRRIIVRLLMGLGIICGLACVCVAFVIFAVICAR